jgi:sigma-B regulation protein RsbU (phosphoserine phosphatase)
VGASAETGQPILVPDVSKDPRYISVNPETRSELCVPLIYKDKVIGILDLEHTRRGYFTEDHMRTISTLAAQLAIAIENARLYEQITRQEKRLEQDLLLARELQYRLLPHCCPVLQKAEIAAKFTPARAIGGDLYDFITYSGGQTAVAIGDVSGKGAPAAIYAALVSGIIRSHAAEEPGAAHMLEAINLSLAERPIEAQYVSMIYAVWDDAQRVLQIANSGLPRPIYCHQEGKIERIEATGLPLGLFPSAEYDEFTFRAVPGDVFVFFSDGILDARNQHGNTFGRDRAEQIVTRNCHTTADEIVNLIFQSVSDFVGDTEQFDDQSVVAIKVKDSNPTPKPAQKRK